MTKVRSSPFAAGATNTGFWGGTTIGRIGLSFLTPRLGHFRSVILYISVALMLQLIFWLVPSLIVSSLAVAFLGMTLGPVFTTAVVLIIKLLPKDLHVGAVGFATAFGGSGGALFSFIFGAIAQSKGVKSLQPVVLCLLAAIAALWLLLPRIGKKDGDESQDDREDKELTLGLPSWKELIKYGKQLSKIN
jgi:fucose permease